MKEDNQGGLSVLGSGEGLQDVHIEPVDGQMPGDYTTWEVWPHRSMNERKGEQRKEGQRSTNNGQYDVIIGDAV